MLIKLLVSFMLIGTGAFGGGLVTIALIQHELVESRHWLEFEEMARIIAIAQMTPGPIAINAATFTGFRLSGVAGAAVATVSVILPAMIILMLLVPWIDRIKNNRFLRRFLPGIKIGTLSLILFAVWSYGAPVITGWMDFFIAAAAFAILTFFEGKIHPFIVIFLFGVVGLFVYG
jgi:chromate transporter